MLGYLHTHQTPDPPSSQRTAITPDIDTLIGGLLAKDPQQRPSTAGHAAIGLRTALARTRRRRIADAERLAGTITHPACRVGAVREIAKAVAAHDQDQARRLLADAEEITVAMSIAHPLKDEEGWATRFLALTGITRRAAFDHFKELEEIAKVVAGFDPADAERIAWSIEDPACQAIALGEVAAATGRLDLDQARRLLEGAERAARSVEDWNIRSGTLRETAKAVARLAPDRARGLLADAEHAARSAKNPSLMLWSIVEAVAEHDPADAERIAHSIEDPHYRHQALSAVAATLSRHDPARTERIARIIEGLSGQAWELQRVATSVAENNPADAERIAHSIEDSSAQAQALSNVAAAVAGHDPGDAERIARSIGDCYDRAVALARTAAATAMFDLHRARELLTDAEHTAHSAKDEGLGRRAVALGKIAAAAAMFDLDQARRLLGVLLRTLSPEANGDDQ